MLRSDFASSGIDELPLDAASIPEKIVLVRRRDRLRLFWSDGEREIDASRLRGACRCGECTRARAVGTFRQVFEGALITHIAPIGDYAINITFADGHARGIFPWSYLRSLACDGEAPSAIGSDPSRPPAVTTGNPYDR